MNITIEGRLNFIQDQRAHIGLRVFRIKNNKFSVLTREEYNQRMTDDSVFAMQNPIDDDSFLYTKEDYNNFCELYLQFQIDRLINDLVKNSHYSNSTHALSNLQHQWITECKQNLIEFFSEIKL